MSLEPQSHFERLKQMVRLPFIRYRQTQPPPSDLYIRLPDASGLGTFLHAKAHFDYLIENGLVRTIYYTLPTPVFRKDYPPQYYDELRQFVLTTNTPRCQLLPDSEDSRCQYRNLRELFVIPAKVTPRASTFRVYPTPPFRENYITLNMKISGVNKYQLQVLLPALIECLNRSKYPIVLVGERSASPCREYEILPDHVSIYSDIVPHLHKYTDKTYDETYNANSITNIETNATLYTYAVYNIIMNTSGGLTFLSYFGKILGFTTGYSPIEKEIEFPTSRLVHTPTAFIQLLKERIC